MLKRDNNSFDMEIFSDYEKDILILVNDADVNSILEQYSGHTINMVIIALLDKLWVFHSHAMVAGKRTVVGGLLFFL